MVAPTTRTYDVPAFAGTSASGRRLGGTPVLTVQVDPALIGGVIVQAGDDVYDGSIRNHLEKLRHRLMEGKTHEIQSRRDQFSHPA